MVSACRWVRDNGSTVDDGVDGDRGLVGRRDRGGTIHDGVRVRSFVRLSLGDRDGADGSRDSNDLGSDMRPVRAVRNLRGALGESVKPSGVDGGSGQVLGR